MRSLTKILFLKSLKANNNINTTVSLFFLKNFEVTKIVLFVRLRLDRVIPCYLFYSITMEICSPLEFIYLSILSQYIWQFEVCHFRKSHWATGGVLEPVCVNLFVEPEVSYTCLQQLHTIITLRLVVCTCNHQKYQRKIISRFLSNLLLTVIWFGFWTDRLIKQILVKSLKGRSGVIEKGVNENVLNSWTKTMQRSAEVITLI